ncbi:MAG: hypothetical protein ABI743_10315 [bacterium]
MADDKSLPTQDPNDYVPDPAEIKKAYAILAFIAGWVAVFIYGLIDTIIRHGNPIDIILHKSGGGGGGH